MVKINLLIPKDTFFYQGEVEYQVRGTKSFKVEISGLAGNTGGIVRVFKLPSSSKSSINVVVNVKY